MNINEIAGKHLGKAGDGSVVKPYVTPDNIDASLLVGVPRHFNRTDYDIKEDDLPFVGMDVWNGYEFSCLLDNGYPVSGLIRWSYPSDSKCIVESKSVKLYLNSFNMAKMGSTVDEAIEAVESQVKTDLEKCVEGEVEVTLHTEEDGFPCTPMDYGFDRLDDLVDVESMSFTAYNETPDTLDVSEGSCYIEVYTSNLRSNCRITNQPDWGDIYIYVKSDTHSVTYESLLQYIVSMRKESHFHEEICECVYKRLYDLLKPEELMVACLYTRRGGIDINPIRATHQELIDEHPMTDVEIQVSKTMRQ